MKRMLLLLFALPLLAQFPAGGNFPPNQPGANSCSGNINSSCSQVTGTNLSAPLARNQGGTNNTAGTTPQQFFGTSAPGSVTGNLPGDLFSDTTNHNEYQCNAPAAAVAPACTSVTAGGWTLLNTSTNSGTVTTISGSGPSWMAWNIATPTSTPVITLSGATGQTSHQVVGTCGAATTVALCLPSTADLSDVANIIQTTTACGGNLTGSFPNCNAPTPAPGAPAGNSIDAGLGVEYTGGLGITVGAGKYTINGTQYTIATKTDLTFTTADPTNPRLDVVIVDVNSAASILPGTASNPAIPPTVNSDTQLQISPSVSIPAAASTPANVSVIDTIFDEGSEWAQTYTAHIALSTNNPFRGTHSVEATAAVLNNNVKFVKPSSGTVDLANANNLTCWVYPKAKFPSGTSGSTAARYLLFYWLNGNKQFGQQYVLRDGVGGFNSATLAYQLITIPASYFGIQGIPVTTLEVQVGGLSGSATIGFYLDACTLQGGLTPPVSLTSMNAQGNYSATKTYNTNDFATLANGVSYLSLAPNTGAAPATNPTLWKPLDPAVIYGCSITNAGAVVAAGSTSTCYFPVPRQCTIVGYYVLANPVDTATIKFWKIAAGTTLPTVSNSINTSGVSLSTGGAIESTTVTDFTTKAVAFNDLMAANLTAVGGAATYVYGGVLCQ